MNYRKPRFPVEDLRVKLNRIREQRGYDSDGNGPPPDPSYNLLKDPLRDTREVYERPKYSNRGHNSDHPRDDRRGGYHRGGKYTNKTGFEFDNKHASKPSKEDIICKREWNQGKPKNIKVEIQTETGNRIYSMDENDTFTNKGSSSSSRGNRGVTRGRYHDNTYRGNSRDFPHDASDPDFRGRGRGRGRSRGRGRGFFRRPYRSRGTFRGNRGYYRGRNQCNNVNNTSDDKLNNDLEETQNEENWDVENKLEEAQEHVEGEEHYSHEEGEEEYYEEGVEYYELDESYEAKDIIEKEVEANPEDSATNLEKEAASKIINQSNIPPEIKGSEEREEKKTEKSFDKGSEKEDKK